MTPSEIRQAVEWACILEATAQKPGNVHPRASFADVDYLDFVRAAIASSEPLSRAAEIGVGRAVYEAVQATRSATRSNVNLGIALLLAPMCAAAAGEWGSFPTTAGVLRGQVASGVSFLTVEDAEHVYHAIRTANPGGLGVVPQQDVTDRPTVTLYEAMALAADRDAIARQYANEYADVFETGLKSIQESVTSGKGWEFAVLHCHLSLMAAIPDTLILRKLGPEMAEESRRRAEEVLENDCESAAVRTFDQWLRSDGNKRNPGASADLTAASLFVAAVTGVFPPQQRSDPRPQ